MEPENPLLDEFVLSLAGASRPRVCFLPTASGDSVDYVARFYRALSALDCRPADLQLFDRPVGGCQCCVPHGTVCRMVSDVYDKLEQELRRGVVVLAVLSQLRTLRYGYELRQSLVDQGLPIEEGTLYPLLRRLEGQGVLSSQWRTTQGPPRRYYALSAEGADLCQRLTASWRGLNKAMDHLLEGEQCDDR